MFEPLDPNPFKYRKNTETKSRSRSSNRSGYDLFPKMSTAHYAYKREHASSGRSGGIRTPGIRFWRPTLYQLRSEEHTSELQSLMRISYAVFCLKKKTTKHL